MTCEERCVNGDAYRAKRLYREFRALPPVVGLGGIVSNAPFVRLASWTFPTDLTPPQGAYYAALRERLWSDSIASARLDEGYVHLLVSELLYRCDVEGERWGWPDLFLPLAQHVIRSELKIAGAVRRALIGFHATRWGSDLTPEMAALHTLTATQRDYQNLALQGLRQRLERNEFSVAFDLCALLAVRHAPLENDGLRERVLRAADAYERETRGQSLASLLVRSPRRPIPLTPYVGLLAPRSPALQLEAPTISDSDIVMRILRSTLAIALESLDTDTAGHRARPRGAHFQGLREIVTSHLQPTARAQQTVPPLASRTRFGGRAHVFLSDGAAVRVHEHYARTTVPPEPFVPSHATSRADLATLEPAAFRYFLHWRQAWREERVEPYDDGYRLLLAQEIVNMIGYDQPEDAFADLIRLSRLDSVPPEAPGQRLYFAAWVRAFIARYGLTSDPVTALRALPPHHLQEADAAVIVGAWLQDRRVESLTIPMLASVAGLKAATAYHTRMRDPELVTRVLRETVRIVLAARTTKRHPDAIDKILGYKNATQLESVCNFPGLLTPPKARYAKALLSPTRITLKRLHALLANPLRHAENICRAAEGERSKRKLGQPPLPPALGEQITLAAERILQPRKTIHVNTRTLQRLERESARVRDRLMSEELRQELTASNAPASPPASILTAGANGLRAFAHALSPLERAVVRAALTGDASAFSALARDGVLLHGVVDRLNERALEYIGDTLLDAGTEPITVLEEYAQELAALERHRASQADVRGGVECT
jgi:hypothetical protein